MFELFRSTKSRLPERSTNITRRTFLGGSVAGAAVALMPDTTEKEVVVHDAAELPTTADGSEDLAGEEITHAVEAMPTNSEHFLTERDQHAAEYVSELQIMECPQELMMLLDGYFNISAIPHEIIRQEIIENIHGLALVESRYDEARVSEVGAFGVMQIMPETWKSLALSEEDPTNVVDQIKVAARYFVQSYRHIATVCRQELADITANHFAGDASAMQKYFFGPVLIGSYNSGMGNLEKIIRSFAERYPTTNETVDMFDGVDIPTGYDVYLGMARAAKDEAWRPAYKTHGSEYVSKVYGATKAMRAVV